MKANGNVELDDAYFAFGMEDSWMFQIGRYEAMDLFSLGKDTALFYAAGGDSMGNGIYYYMAKEGRGRADSADQARIVGEFGNWTGKVSSVYGNTKGYFDKTDNNQHLREDIKIESTGDSFLTPPAFNYLSDSGDVSVSFGGEWEANDDSVKGTVIDGANLRL